MYQHLRSVTLKSTHVGGVFTWPKRIYEIIAYNINKRLSKNSARE